jgi:hypothetical protein
LAASKQVPQRVRNDSLIKLRTFLEANLASVEVHLRSQSEDDEGEDVAQQLRRLLHHESSTGSSQV